MALRPMARHGPIYIQKEGTTNKITNAGIPMVVGRAANFKGPRGSHRTLSHPVEDPLDPRHTGKVP